MSMKTKRAELLASAMTIATKAHDEDRSLTPSEAEHINRTVEQVKELDARSVLAKEHAQTLARLAGPDTVPDGVPGHLALGKALAGQITAQMLPSGAKALLPAGTVVTTVPMDSSPVTMGRAPAGLLDVLPSVVTAPSFSYLRQNARNNNAAPVAPGAIKPTSTYGLERIEGRLRVIAHVSEPVDKYMLEDAPSLERFLADEMIFGLAKAVEAQVFNGTGVGEDLVGLDNVSGTQAQPYVTSPILTARSALTAVETVQGTASGFYVLSPQDWQAIETSTLSGGAYVLAEAGTSTPINSATRRLWGQPVVVTVGQAPGAGWFIQSSSVTLNTDGAVELRWSGESGESFERNQLRARCEARYDLSIHNPDGVVKLDLTA